MQLKGMLKTMKQEGIPEDVIYPFECIAQEDNGAETEIKFVEKMDEFLTDAQCFRVWECNGGCKGTKHDAARKAFALENADKPLAVKLMLYMQTFNPLDKLCLNNDNTLTVTFAHKNNGVHTGAYTCHCPTIKSLKQPFTVSPTFCGCAAGGRLYVYQLAFGIKLKLKSIDSSVLGSNGEKLCSFTYKIVE
jgi:hypothetical protein